MQTILTIITTYVIISYIIMFFLCKYTDIFWGEKADAFMLSPLVLIVLCVVYPVSLIHDMLDWLFDDQ